ncbi:Hypothetical predicted protein [Olea europaea subsp. europaea]|uniref:Uncharacterized protein n=1 Tax=Olea europaea subsp. europaea TaxID=158383 RepID=A0A8S0Q5M6_OLEEU|nr:Hypothetical predicted protein [Olea europaea subsp. europaea]
MCTRSAHTHTTIVSNHTLSPPTLTRYEPTIHHICTNWSNTNTHRQCHHHAANTNAPTPTISPPKNPPSTSKDCSFTTKDYMHQLASKDSSVTVHRSQSWNQHYSTILLRNLSSPRYQQHRLMHLFHRWLLEIEEPISMEPLRIHHLDQAIVNKIVGNALIE